jgi:hypothetical protein
MNVSTFAQTTMTGFAKYATQEMRVRPNLDYQVVKVVDTPRVLSVCLRIDPRYYRKFVSANTEFSMAMGLESKNTVRFARALGNSINIEIPKPVELSFSFNATELPSAKGLKIPVGFNFNKEVMTVDFGDPFQAHLLICGSTGTGKTLVQQTVAQQLAKVENTRGIVIDVEKNGVKWGKFANTSFLAHPVITEEGEAVQALNYFLGELEDRRKRKLVPPQVPHEFIIIDELSSLLDGDAGPSFAPALKKITQVGREFGIHAIVNTQYPINSSMGTPEAKRQFNVRFVGHFDDGVAAKNASGLPNSGAQYLTGPGDFLLIKDGGMERFYAAMPGPFNLTKGVCNKLHLEPSEDVQNRSQGRPTEPFDPRLVGEATVAILQKGSPKSFSTFGTWFNQRIGEGKAKRYYDFTLDFFKYLDSSGYRIVKKCTT